MIEVGVVRTGTANLASVLAALKRIGCACSVVERPDDLVKSRVVVLPGVGAFGQAMEGMRERGLVDALRLHFSEGKPALAICLGMQVLFESSEESPGVVGMGLLPGSVVRIDSAILPQIGWNRIDATACAFQKSGHAYFANTFAVPHGEFGDWKVSQFEYGRSYVAGIERGAQLACQFHPELSGQLGLEMLTCWLAEARSC